MRKLASDVWTGWRTGPARAGLAFLSLALGLFAVTILMSTLDALRRQAQELVQSFGAGSFVLVRSVTETGASVWNRSQVNALRENLGADAWVAGVRRLPSPAGSDLAVASTDETLARARGWRFAEGRALDALDLRQGARHAMAPASLCRRNGWHVGDLMVLGNEPFRLVGSFESGTDSAAGLPTEAVFIPFTCEVLETRGADTRMEVETLVFRAQAGIPPEGLQRRVATLLEQPGWGSAGVEWITPESLLQGIRRWQRAIGWTAGSGGALGLLLGAVTLAGMLLTGVRERVPEIGLRRALGARRLEIAKLFVAEALALTAAAAVVALMAAEGILRWLGGRFPLPFHFGWETRLLPLALACGIALICSIGPAWLAARLPPAEALRNE